MKFRTPFQYETSKGEIHKNKETKTVTSRSISIRDILKNYTTGVPIPNNNNQIYTGDLPDVRNLDMVELNRLKKRVADNIRDFQANERRKANELAALNREKLFNDAVEKRLKEITS